MLDAGTGLGDAPAAPFLGVRQRLVLAALALGVGWVQHGLEVIGVVSARGTDLKLSDQLVTEERLAMFLHPLRFDFLLAPLG